MTVRNVKKSLIGMQDIAQGIVDVTQTRNASSTVVRKVDIPFPCASTLEMQNLDITKYTRARVYLSTESYLDYLYDGATLNGIDSNTGSGSWILVSSSKNNIDIRSVLYDFDVNGGSLGPINLTEIFPNSSITKAWYEVITAPVSAGAATISIGVDTDDTNGIKTSTAYNDATFALGYHDAIPDGSAANFTTKTTGERYLIFTIGGAALTAGKIRIWFELIRSE